ncbi:hypothetical protein BJV78DRAFT_1285679 [Lactifluus subvellereus]|nr:hypothetical protein BJV78DRAFT_1285679 [Lactifluus subvellereus]
MDPSALAQPTVPISTLLHTTPGLSHDQDPIANAENELRYALNDLEAAGVLQHDNRMDIEGLLNPSDESQMIDETTDEEICQAVLAAWNAQEEGPINGGDDDVEDNTLLGPNPTYHEVFQALSVINRHVECHGDPLSRKVDAILASFRCQMRLERSQSLVPTRVTDYFNYI